MEIKVILLLLSAFVFTCQAKDPKRVVLNVKNVAQIEVYKDGDHNTATGYGYSIYFLKDRVNRDAGNYDDRDLVGIEYSESLVDSDSKYLTRAVWLINNSGIFIVPSYKPEKAANGVTKIIITGTDGKKITLAETKIFRNFKGDLQKLVDKLVELTGGEPEFGDPIVPEPVPFPDPDDDIIY